MIVTLSAMPSHPVSDPLRRALRQAIAGGASQGSIARAIGAATPMVNRFLLGRRGLRLDRIDALAAFLGLELQPRRKARRGR